MNSIIRQLYSNIASQSVTFTREQGTPITVTALDLHQLKAVEDADAPIRLILPYSTYTEQRNGLFATLGPVAPLTKPEWIIVDLLLWRRGDLSNLHEVAPDLVRYQGAYIDTLRGFRAVGTSGIGVTLDGSRLAPGVYDWPIRSTTLWHGVMAILTVTERLSGLPA
jgi:hypothetical protein